MGINNYFSNEEEEEESKFGINGTLRCYCGKKIKVEYNEITGLKDTRCKSCGYNHLDIIYAVRKQVEEAAKNKKIKRPFYYTSAKKKKWYNFFN